MGLFATDGCLGGGKTVTFTSCDRDLVESFRDCIGWDGPLGRNGRAFRVQVSDVRFFDWLCPIGITPRKSLTLGALAVPRHLLAHTVRGLLDGDGSVITSMTVPNRARYPEHSYQRLRVYFLSASPRHIDWLRELIGAQLGAAGWVTTKLKRSADKVYAPPRRDRRPGLAGALHGERGALDVSLLRYSKHESIRLLEWLYESNPGPCLERKRRKWRDFRDHGKPTQRWHRVGLSAVACENVITTPE